MVLTVLLVNLFFGILTKALSDLIPFWLIPFCLKLSNIGFFICKQEPFIYTDVLIKDLTILEKF